VIGGNEISTYGFLEIPYIFYELGGIPMASGMNVSYFTVREGILPSYRSYEPYDIVVRGAPGRRG
jgi:hypothetical protein